TFLKYMTKTKKNSFKRYLFLMWAVLASGILFSILFFWGISKGMAGEMPTFEDIENPESFLATEIYSSDSVLLGKYYRENRSNATWEDIENTVIPVLIATEDERYFNHAGIDLEALVRAIINLGKSGGGSTLSQQLAKNLFRTRINEIEKLEEELGEEVYQPTFIEKMTDGSKLETIFDKLKEWVIAVQLEKSYTKEEILTMYLNTVEFSDNAFGIKSAAKTYFNKDVTDLEVIEAAVLVGMLKAPYKFNPRVNPEDSKQRRNVVLLQMSKAGHFDEAEKERLQGLPLEIDFTQTSHIEGIAPYFRETLRAELAIWAKENTKPNGENYNIYTDGLKVYTTIDSRMQVHAEESVSEHLGEMQDIFWEHWSTKDPWEQYKPSQWGVTYEDQWENFYKKSSVYQSLDSTLTDEEKYAIVTTPKEMTVWSHHGEIDTVMSTLDSLKYYRMFLQTGFIAMDPSTGYVKAWVGGINYEYFKYDHANINTKRQIGSTFKPFVYTLAIKEKGYSPCIPLPNEKVTFEKDDPRWHLNEAWTPQNSDGEYGGYYTLKGGLANSVNTIVANLMHELSPEAVIDLARKMGISSPIDAVPSICLGVADLSVYEMVAAYSTFPNKGIQTTPLVIDRIEDAHGNIIEDFYPERSKALDEETAYVMTQMLRGVIDGGTGYRCRFKYGIPTSLQLGGKTGTTQNNSDGWFMGFSPDLVAGTWVGCEDRFVRFRTTYYGQGASLALPIWAKFMKRVYEDENLDYDINAKFEKPEERVNVDFNCKDFLETMPNAEDYSDEYE
ncbi:MAG: penicillin-binding protein 1A, partial [Chitinophagales bacterium]